MKKIYTLIAPLFLSTLLFAHPEEPTSPINADVMWHTITVVDYKPGTENEAKALIQKFETATETAGTSSPAIYWFESGKYDLVVTWKHPDGHSDLKDNWSQDEALWWKALIDQEGSEQAALKLQTDYKELIASSVTKVARKAK